MTEPVPAPADRPRPAAATGSARRRTMRPGAAADAAALPPVREPATSPDGWPTPSGGEVVDTADGRYVRVEGPRRRPAGRSAATRRGCRASRRRTPPLVCLDTETTGLATAAGTVAFLIGLGWWAGDTLPAGPAAPARPRRGAARSSTRSAGTSRPTPGSSPTTGAGFDWPLLVTRYRLVRRAAPTMPATSTSCRIVRRLFRHRMDDARLRTVERLLLGRRAHDDVDGWEIPGRYLGFLRGGPAQPLAAGRPPQRRGRPLAGPAPGPSSSASYATAEARVGAPAATWPGWPARSAASGGSTRRSTASTRRWRPTRPWTIAPWRSADHHIRSDPAATGDRGAVVVATEAAPTSAGRRGRVRRRPALDRREAFARPWDDGRIAVDRAHLLRRLGRIDDAVEAWDALACGPGRGAILAAIERAKLREHRLADPTGAMASVERGLARPTGGVARDARAGARSGSATSLAPSARPGWPRVRRQPRRAARAGQAGGRPRPGRTGGSPLGPTRWQRASCVPPAGSTSTGASVEHRSMAIGQRGWKRHPDGGSSGLGGSPGRTTRARVAGLRGPARARPTAATGCTGAAARRRSPRGSRPRRSGRGTSRRSGRRGTAPPTGRA